MRRAAKRDDVEESIVVALEADGCLVHVCFEGNGFPDLLVWSPHLRKLLLLEVKTGNEGFTPAQKQWHERWRTAPAYVVRTIGDALKVVRNAA